MMPEKPSPKIAVTANRPISSCVLMIAMIERNCQSEPVSTVVSPPMRSEIQPHIWREKNAVASSSESIAAPCVGLIPRSLHNATRCDCGIDIGMQQQNAASDIMANTRLGGQPSTVGRAAWVVATGGAITSGGGLSTINAIGTTITTITTANISMVCRQP